MTRSKGTFQKGHKKVGGFVKGNKHSKETKLKMSLAKVGYVPWNKGKKMPKWIVEKNRLAHLGKPCPKKFSNTSIERKVRAKLQEKQVWFIEQVALFKIAKVDFFLPEYNTIIECDGCYWHGCRECNLAPKEWQENKVKDKTITWKYTEMGFNFLRLWEHEINDSVLLEKEIESIVNPKIFPSFIWDSVDNLG